MEPFPYTPDAPDREQLYTLAGGTVIEFGTNWCGYCQRAQPVIAEALGRHPAMRHLKVEDGPGRPLGRSFRVKLWPTLIFLRDGQERARVVRPTRAEELDDALATLR
ncbi:MULTISPECIES: thioredoxin family protein [Burkholderiaceae]|uniref:thioredoxin family protein n=1 Tax=Burkholderiaceae TaxID=119060 RepID=UPI0009676CE0|nr:MULTISPECIES: thioredoxin family protein [Burkholderiaceae]MCF2135432.1 thioredoxin family protein [Mycetohabitans sp. B3]MCG1040659.1 thioredoxin family protein [Mycetohabitans sp. B7]SIT65137.1 thioredoxin 1 [Burkholderia sp. b14]